MSGLDFPALGSTVERPLFPTAPPGSPQASVKIHVRLVGAGKARSWAFRLEGARQRDARRLAELRKGTTAETAPEVWAKEAMTPEGFEEYFVAKRRAVAEAVVRVEGVRLGGVDLASETDAERITEALDCCGLLDAAALVIIEAQSPRADQVF